MSNTRLVWICGLLMSLSAISIDITLPALGEIASHFNAPVTAAQWTVTAYFIALGVGQLFWGVMSDRFGRRAVLLAGIVLFVLQSVAVAFSSSMEMMLAARCLQGFAAASAMVCARAILRDLFEGHELARAMALAMAVFAVGPMVAPFIGAALLHVVNWQAVYLGLALYGVAMVATVWAMPETNRNRNPAALSPKVIGAGMRAILADGQSRWFLALAPFAMAPMVVMLSMMPPVYASSFGVEGFAFAALFAAHGLGIIAGQLVNRRVISSIGPLDTMLLGAALMVGVGLAMILLALIGTINAIIMTALFILFATSFLVVVANATSLYLNPHGRIAGLATAVFTAVSQLGAGMMVTLAVWWIPVSPLGIGIALAIPCVITLCGGLAWRRRSAHVEAEAASR